MAELAPRDIVARAIFWQYDKGATAYLDARNITNFADRFPTVTALALSMDLNPADHLLPVSPAAHYYMGGIDADSNGRTSVAGLWAVGECSSTGVHGANRLASNSLLEGLRILEREWRGMWPTTMKIHRVIRSPLRRLSTSLSWPDRSSTSWRQVMWNRVGLVRTGNGLWEARSHILDMDRVLSRTIAGRVAADLSIMVVLAALRRSESRGGHYRADYPEMDPMQEHRSLVDPTRVDLVRVR